MMWAIVLVVGSWCVEYLIAVGGNMNIVKGVADLIRRTSGGQSGDFVSEVPSEKFNPTSPAIRFRYCMVANHC